MKVRFAPSPTGPFSLGNARTALFNWVFAKKYGGEFLLRIEDTDAERSKPEFEKEILEGLKWLGLNWSGDIHRQSERLDVYGKYLSHLIEKGSAYYCFCAPEELERGRKAQLNNGLAPKYNGKCSSISPNEAKKKVEAGERAVVRLRMPTETIKFNDLIRGEVEFDGSLIGDFVIAVLEHDQKPRPLYNFAVVIDDSDMEITHVIRGEDHISNTPRQIAIQHALDVSTPEYAHLPLILAPGGKKLSKRDMGKSLMDYKLSGYLPEAMVNFLIMLGWHSKEDKEIASRDEMIKEFSLDRVQKGGAVLDAEKLNWINGHYIKETDVDDLVRLLDGLVPTDWQKDKGLLKRALEVEKERINALNEFRELAEFFFKLPNYESELLIWKDKKEESLKGLKTLNKKLSEISDNKFSSQNIKPILLELADEMGGKGEVFWPIRVALSGQKFSPGALEIIDVLGKTKTIQRLKVAIVKLENV